jgi:hypothetical protein
LVAVRGRAKNNTENAEVNDKDDDGNTSIQGARLAAGITLQALNANTF